MQAFLTSFRIITETIFFGTTSTKCINIVYVFGRYDEILAFKIPILYYESVYSLLLLKKKLLRESDPHP